MADFDASSRGGKRAARKEAYGLSGRRMGWRPHFRYRTSMIMFYWIYAYIDFVWGAAVDGRWMGGSGGRTHTPTEKTMAFDHQTKFNPSQRPQTHCVCYR